MCALVQVDSFKRSTSALDVSLHPLVVINISDHFTRNRLSAEKGAGVYGICLGTQKGRMMEIRTSFEVIALAGRGGEISIEEQFLRDRWAQCLFFFLFHTLLSVKQVFKNYDMVGWYRVGNNVQPSDLRVHERIGQLAQNDNLVFLLCGAQAGMEVKQLPVHLFEGAAGSDEWSYITYKIETEISEQISLDHVARNVAAGREQSAVVSTYNKYSNAIVMLQRRLQIIVKFLKQTRDGGIAEWDHDLMRRCAYLASRLPSIDSEKFDVAYGNEVNEVLLITYLSSMTQATHQFDSLIDKYNVTYEQRKRHGGPMGRFGRDMF